MKKKKKKKILVGLYVSGKPKVDSIPELGLVKWVYWDH